ncbi:hypothetical protein GW756_00800 [bacterium]|nr:hypothetical protein [bacterium]NCQ54896.1 hypothetical protein [Candidatus Parcubacteria bacterium]NCS66940.1 hypothetical protein [Candidatus Peregrinibacteria bacterium]NCS95887.1 hypothetical protein [bacterium]
MPEEEEKKESTEKKSQITPAEAEKRVSTAVAEVIPDENDSLLIEEDGDPFWVIQRVFWGILKTGALLALLLFLIWLVWRPSSFLGNGNEPEFEFEPEQVEEVQVPEENRNAPWWKRLFGGGDETPEPEFTPENPENPAPQNPNLESTDPTQIAYELETARVLLVRGIIPQSVQWLRQAKTVGEISMQVLRQGSPQARSRQIEEILAAADDLFVQSANLQIQLQAERDYFLTEGNAANARTAELEQQIAYALQVLDPVPVEALVAEKIASQQNASFFMSNAKIRDTLNRNIQTFDQLLRQRSIPLLNPATEIRAN